jgi:hypothetical protein
MSTRFQHIDYVIDSALLGNKDIGRRAKGRMLRWAKEVWLDLNLSTVKKVKREEFKINKRTNTVKMPFDFQYLSSVNVMDHHGVEWPVYRNDRLHIDVVEIPADKNCACENGCGYQLCNTIKGYEAITSIVTDSLPNGTPITFTCISRKAVDRNGFLYLEWQYPLHVFTNGVWTDTILQTEQKKLCECETDENGCICDSEENWNRVCEASGILGIPFGGDAQQGPTAQSNTWIYHCNSKQDWFNVQCGHSTHFKKDCNQIYNINELGDTLIFPHHFGFDKVIVRYYYDVDLQHLEIPVIAVPTFIMGLKFWDNQYDDMHQDLAKFYGSRYSQMKFGLLKDMNMYRIAENAQILTPKTHVPSYIDHRQDRYRDGYLY